MLKQDFILTDNPNELDWQIVKLFFLFEHETPNPKEFHVLPTSTTIEELNVISEAFTSKGQARKAGFFGAIPVGFSKGKGTKKKPIWILKLNETLFTNN